MPIDYSDINQYNSVIVPLNNHLENVKKELLSIQSSENVSSERVPNKNPDGGNSDYYSKLPAYSGKVTVFTNSPILAKPEIGAESFGVAENETVTILYKKNKMFYYVQSGKITGFLWVGWIK
jgi:hypothetical protein